MNQTNAQNVVSNEKYNINPSIWGPHLWATIHTLALKADIEGNPHAFSAFLGTLTELLPCETCRSEFIKYVTEHGRPEQGSAFAWTVHLHNWVNQRLGKQEILTIEDARSLWQQEHCSYQCNKLSKNEVIEQSSSSFINIFYILIVILCLYVLYAYMTKNE